MKMKKCWRLLVVWSLGVALSASVPEENGINFRFTRSLYNVTIPENSASKVFVTPQEKIGIHQTNDDLDVRFKIVSGDKEKFFKAEERLVGDFWFLLLRTRTGNIDVLNRERKDRYVLEIKAVAMKRDGKKTTFAEAETTVVVTVLDVNDLNPLFYPTEYEEIVPEDTNLHESILRVSAEDADLGRNGEIYYSFKEPTEHFALSPTTGVVTLTRLLRYSERSVHHLTVLAQDRGAAIKVGSKPSTAKLKIIVKQVNLYSPEITIQHLPDIVENSNADIYAIVKVKDRDDGIHGEIRSLEIVDGDPDGHFRIKPGVSASSKVAEYNIEVLKLLDRENKPRGYNLTLKATDRGVPPRETYKSIPIRIADLNDNPPIFDREIYVVDIPESAPINSPIIRLKVTDADQGKNAQTFLEIVGGNEGEEFHINPDTGMLYTNVKMDAETKSMYTLTVTAIDQGNTGTRKQSSAKVKINVVDTNDNDPLFEKVNMEVEIPENEPIGSSVAKVIAKDKDSGENAYISYSIANLNDVPFEIDHFIGVVKTNQVLDYESMRRSYVIRIRASDWGLPYRRETETQLKITIKDVNDNRPQFEKVDCVGRVSRFTPIGSEIITLSAIDFDAGNIISYRLVGGNEDNCFSLDATSGVVTVTCDLSDIGVSERVLNVTATDGTHFADVVNVVIKLVNYKQTSGKLHQDITDDTSGFDCKDTGVTRKLAEILAASEKSNSNGYKREREEFAMMPSRYGENVHAPEFSNFPINIQVNESMPIGTVLVKIKATDRDLGYNGMLIFGISSGDHSSVFRLDPETGELKVVGFLDRERDTEYNLNITVFDQGKPQKSTSRMLPITILDVNDNAPKFKTTLASFRITENALNGTAFYRVNATDRDEGDNANIFYTLMTDTDDFRVDPEQGTLFVSAPLDRERQEVYELVIRATDCAGNPGSITALHSDALIRVMVDDVNDNPPSFSLSSYTVKAREDIPIGSVIAALSANDPDLGSGGEVRYSIIGQSYSDNLFAIDSLTGTIRLIKPLDFEDRQVLSFMVSAADKGTPSLSSEVTLIVEVVDVNENLYAPVFPDFVITGSVFENQPPGTVVVTVNATDADPPKSDDSRIGYSIKGGDGLGYFSIDSQGNIRTATVLDTETKAHYWLTIVAFDYGVVPLHSTLEVYIEVKNVNDNVPLTTEPVYYPHIKENSIPGTPIVQLTVFDPDSITITYRITSGNPESLFSIDTHSGVISTTGRKLDREHQAEHILEVTVTDDGTPPLSSTTRVVITVDDENDNSPQFQYNFYSVHIPETRHHEAPLIQTNSGETDIGQEIQLVNGTWESFPENDAGEKLFRVIAVDNDFGKNGLVFYELMSGRGKRKFKIHPTTGEIYSTSSFQHGEEYNLFVRATDYGNPNRSSNAKVTVQVLPLPEDSKHAPTCPTKDHHVSVHESDAVGFLVMLMQCEDEDKDALWYKIIDGDPRSEFTIVGEEGSILIAKPLDWELQSKYNLTISVTDGINTTLTNVFVTVVDINEHRPVFSKSLYTANISESLSLGSEVLRLAATDADQDSKVVYSLYSAQSPSSLVLFKVDYYTGSLSVAKPLDRETISEHILTVMVKDQATPAKRNFARVIINISDANDHAPEFSVSLMQGRVFETSPPGTTILSLNAVDKDHGLNAKVSYSLQSGTVGNPFSLDPILGTINVARDLDINTRNEYMLIVKATDAGNPPLASTIPVHIMVVMADNAPPRFTRKEVAAELYENELPGLIVIHLEARSTSSLHYELVQGNVDNAFYLNPTTGVIYTNVPLDYEKIKVYNLTVTATNMAGAKAFCHVVVHLLDRNDNPPVFHETLYEGWINEGSPIASLVFSNQSSHLILTASDRDSQLNSLLQYDIIEPGPRRLFHIDSTTGAIRTTVSLDHETDPVIEFHVRVTDLGKPRLSSEALAKVIIRVIDVNDCSPKFSQRVYNTSILIPTYNDIAVLQLNASDKDSPNLTKLVYSIKSGNSDNIYSILPDDGIIQVHDPVRGAKSAPHRLKVEVSDGKFSDEAMVFITWENSQNSGLKFQKSIYYGSVLENSTKQNTVAIVTVLGSHLNEHLMFSILNPSSLFTIGTTSGAVRTTGAKFDRELQEHYQLIVQVRSQESSDDEIRVAHVPVNITVLDVNDNCPIFVNLPYYAVVSVDAQKGDVITKVHAIDLDKGENGEVRYELIRGHGELFKVCRKSGEITLKQGLEGHNREYQLIIAAYDGGSRPCSTEVFVVVKVMDKSMPIFDKQFYTVSVLENIDLHSPLSLSIQAESPLGRKLIYSIVQGNTDEKFSVDFNTASDSRVNGPCGLYVVDELDHETQPEYALTVRATDGVSGVSDDVLVNVLVLDVNDCPPEFTMDVYNVSVSEAAPFGTVILKLSARDNDTGINAKIKYSLENNYHNATEYFHIDPDDGSIYLKRSLDHEAQSVHHIIATATDCGFPSLSTTVHIWIMVLDMNDNPPKLEKNTYTWLSEEASRGQIVTIVTAIDPDSSDHNRLLYSIVGGNQQQTFSMDSTSGIVTLTNLHKLTESRIHILNVSVSDGVYTSFTKVTIEMVSANKHSPEFEKHLYETKVAENSPAGTFVIKVFAVDRDSDQYSVLSYYINSDAILESFSINNMTGEIFTKAPLDREKQKTFEIPLVAIDTGGKMGFSAVRVSISDVNDNPPVFVLPEYKACIYSNLSVNSGFLKVKAIDADEEESGQIEYSIYEKVESGVRELFHVNKNTGGLTLLRSSVPFENQVYQFFIRATDKGKPPLHSDVPVDIYVMTQKDIPPIFERKDDKFFVTENAPTGSLITVVKLLNNIPVNYKLLSGKDYFTIDPNGAISLSASLDREAVASHVIGVLASTESSPPLTALTEISLQVLDANDNRPIFDNVEYKVKVAENIKEGSSILKVHAHDDDEGTNGEVHYSLAPGTSSFAIDSHTGWVTSLVPLDRETKPTYRLTVTATDSGTTTHVANTTIFISLIDYNDNPPKFLQDSYTASVSENAIPGTVVVQVSVSDLDSEITNVVFYIIDGDPHSQFDVKVTGEVYVARPLDRETIDEYQLTIFATDGKHIAMTTLVIEILDENDQEPYCLRYRYKETISEGVPPGFYFQTIRAMDLDLDSNLKYYLTGDHAEYFSLDKLTGELKTAKNLDRETIAEFHLTAHVQDRDHSDWECMTYIDISIMDINDNAPSFSASNFTATLSEGAQIGSLVTKMHAIDADIGVNRKIRYILTDSANDYFKMASDSGIITLAKVLDRETQDSYTLTVKAVDQGLPQLWKEVPLTVHVLDVNDNPPEFQTRAHHASIPESASIDTQVTQVVATSKDTGINAKIRYSIIGGNEHGKFAIEPDKGIISIAQPLDYERATEYLLQIQAVDLGTPPLSNQATVNITVLDSNDNAPSFTDVSYSARISENASVGAVVAQVTATDIDTDINGQVMYSIERGDPDQRFTIDSKTGKVTVAQSLDRELVSNYKLQIRATDGGEPILSTFTILNVDVLDVNDNPPLFTQTNYTVIVQEDKRPGWVVCKLLVTDSDTSPNAGPFIFEILSDKGRSAFRIEKDGTVRTAALLSHKRESSYSLHVRVYDNGNIPLYSDTWVIVKVIEESQYPPIPTPLEIWVGSYEERWGGGEIGQVFATDQDQYDTLNFSIVPKSSESALFVIDPRQGILSTLPGLDNGLYRLNVSVSDGKFTSYTSVTVTVESIWDEMVLQSYSIRVPSISPKSFIISQRKSLLKQLRLALMRDVSLLSVQDTGNGDTQVLLFIKGEMDIVKLNSVLETLHLPLLQLECNCLNEGLCRQKISLNPERMLRTSNDFISFVAPAHAHEVYCACNIGFSGEQCEEKMPPAECECPAPQTCIAQPSPPGFVCAPPSPASPLCSPNHTCPPILTPSFKSALSIFTWQQLLIAGIFLILILVFCIICLVCRCCCRRFSDSDLDKTSAAVLNSDVKRTSKLSNLEVSQCVPRPASYTLGSNNDVYAGPLNNLDTVRSYGSAGDELENVPPDYVKNLNRNAGSLGHKINNDVKRLPEAPPPRGPRRTLSCVEDDARILGGYHWDCSDWVRPNHNPLPNITEVPGSEVPDSSSFHSNDSNDSNHIPQIQHHIQSSMVDPARDLATLDEELYMTYRSEEDDVVTYGFPQRYPSQSDVSTNLCDIEDSDVPT